MASEQEDIAAKIAGSIVFSPQPCKALKAWRERLEVKQNALATAMRVSPSVLSDYESGRRASPGIAFIKRYIEALIDLGSSQKRVLARLSEPQKSSAILALGEFATPIPATRIVEALSGKTLSGFPMLDSKIYGYTVLDSIKTIYALSGFDFYRIFGATTERALVFTKVGLGRSPLVAIRVSPLKPRMVVIHGPSAVDPLAVDLAERERIILVLSRLAHPEALIDVFKALDRKSI